MTTKPKNSARLEFRLTADNKALIELAAAAMGQTVSDFATDALVHRAHDTLRESSITQLTNRDRDLFLAMLDDDTEPNEALRDAAERYRRGG